MQPFLLNGTPNRNRITKHFVVKLNKHKNINKYILPELHNNKSERKVKTPYNR